MSDPSCLLCRYFKPQSHTGWEPTDRHHTYSMYDVKEQIKDTGFHQRGWCRLNPCAEEVMTDHVCSWIKLADHAIRSTQEFIWGTWRERDYDLMKEQVTEMTRQLKIARKISRGRLQRIKKLKKR